MSTTYRGGCRCGATRYETAAEPMFGGQCQCLDCQRETGGGHASFIAFPAAAVKLTGTARFYEGGGRQRQHGPARLLPDLRLARRRPIERDAGHVGDQRWQP